jgi:hypothetical protein
LTSAPIIFVYQSSNPNHGARKLRKAGQSRWLGRRPIVRGVAMNPATKGAWGMSWRQKALKGVEDCEKLGGVVKQMLIPCDSKNDAFISRPTRVCGR